MSIVYDDSVCDLAVFNISLKKKSLIFSSAFPEEMINGLYEGDIYSESRTMDKIDPIRYMEYRE
jgi:hypothetical protein